MNKISLYAFKKATHHKKVNWVWNKVDGSKVKEFSSDKFYCNKESRLNMLSMPRFNLSSECEFFDLVITDLNINLNLGILSLR